MTEIISFYAAARRLNRPTDVQKPMGGPAQLLFFTGVRYERPEVEIDIQAQRKPRKRKVVVATPDAAIGS
ncbi:hypothetical protein [Agrobacterium sp. lyk4-40-TYG-31]|uniref:hypothetical protein n=1 Tax=Agrobacterium sp. lyk4-40-TYG-31 TaxID=3040276 RepID=UPI00254C967C|nr:hypothetical protein [Agrobacterium sp. lyk4-40-TYG-31]